MGVLAVDFREKARNWWGLLVSNRASFEGRRDGGEGQGAGVVQRVWTGVEMWKEGMKSGSINGRGRGGISAACLQPADCSPGVLYSPAEQSVEE